ncbi:AMP-binding dehydrogenase [Schizosaccharomyces cryophilus OY26]|uniref:AMP-binding dehydrogenase n=1 Tax=Schizosaccharomyces cryophilus (strain OY26 / ATCC MYA-4695 / CBS 11777 / NBRC 106824 / NRRL Y48691) TaxID=653667 RepID=S9X555_SCHCR|nr:AMP-binding dehydrogenase [Schizosaccharomyces cryophilus OY26]EPY52227.1 AMP-binding dehydrogenase [Schizosaccharomyces cryophilus OY26]
MSPKSSNTTSFSSILTSPREEDTPVARLLRNANETPDHRFIYVYNEYGVVAEYTYKELLRRVNAVAKFCNDLCLGKTVGIHMGHELDFLSTIFALWATGRTCVIFNHIWSQGVVHALVQRLDISDLLYHEYAPAFQVDSLNVISFACLQTDLNVPCIRAGLEPEVALINHSSGSTGVPKSMPFLMKKYAFGYDYGTPEFMNHLSTPMVMAPSFALTTMSWLNAFYCNGSLLYPSSSISSNFISTSEVEQLAWNVYYALRAGCERLIILPNLLILTLQIMPDKSESFPSCKLVVAGGEMVPANMYHICKRVLPNAIIYPQYGTTESGLVSFFAPNGEDTLHSKELVYFPGKTVNKLLLLTENNEPVLEKIGREGFVCVVTDVQSEPYVGGDTETVQSRDSTFIDFHGEPAIRFADLAVWNSYKGKLGITIKGRVGRRVKRNGIFFDLQYFDQVALGLKDVEASFSFFILNRFVLAYVPAYDGVDPALLKEILNKELRNPNLFSKCFPFTDIPHTAAGKVDLKSIEAYASKCLYVEDQRLPILSNPLAIEISKIAAKVLQNPTLEGKDASLYSCGLDSIHSFQLKGSVSSVMDSNCTPSSLASVIQEKSLNLSKITYGLLHEDACALARTIPMLTIMHTNGQYVLLTGATGYFGRRFLEYLLKINMSVVCLIRDSSDKAAEERLTSLVPSFRISGKKLIVWAAHLEETRFGLDNSKWNFLIENVSCIYHMGAEVHWMKSYQELRPVNVLGTKTILELSVMGPKALYFISGGGQQEIEFDDRIESTKASGYALSKFVSEILCKKVKDLGHPSIYVIRPGFIIASDGGILSRDFFWRFVVSALRMGAFPQYSESQPLLFRISTTNALCVALTQIMEKQADGYAPLLAYDTFDGNEFARICKSLKKKKLKFVSLEGWLKALEKDIDEEGEDHPLFTLQQTTKFALESGLIPNKGLKNIYPLGETFLTKEAIASGLDNLYIE